MNGYVQRAPEEAVDREADLMRQAAERFGLGGLVGYSVDRLAQAVAAEGTRRGLRWSLFCGYGEDGRWWAIAGALGGGSSWSAREGSLDASVCAAALMLPAEGGG